MGNDEAGNEILGNDAYVLLSNLYWQTLAILRLDKTIYMLELNHKKMQAWSLGMELLVQIYTLASLLPTSEKYNLVSQMQRAALSITNNIAEGAARKSVAERRRFYEVARSSSVEVDNCFEVILKMKWADESTITAISRINESVFKLLSKMMNSEH